MFMLSIVLFLPVFTFAMFTKKLYLGLFLCLLTLATVTATYLYERFPGGTGLIHMPFLENPVVMLILLAAYTLILSLSIVKNKRK